MENVAAGMKKMTLQPSKEVPKLQSTSHDISGSAKDVNFNSVSSCYSKKRCRIHNRDNMRRLDSFKGTAMMSSSFGDSLEGHSHKDDTSLEQANKNALALIKEKPKELDEFNMPTTHKRVRQIEHIPSRATVMIPSTDITNCSQAATSCNHSNRKGVDNIFGVPEDELVKAIEKIVIGEDKTPHDHQGFTQKVINNLLIEEKKHHMVYPRWGWMDTASQYDRPLQKIPVLNQTVNVKSDLDEKYLLLDRSNKGTQMVSPNTINNKEATTDDWIPRHYSMGVWSENSLMNQAAASQDDKMSRLDILTSNKNQKTHSSRSKYLSNQAISQKNFRGGNFPSPVPYQTPVAKEQRRKTGTVPTLLRTTSIGPHAKIDPVEEPQPYYCNQRSRLSGNKTPARNHQHSHQIVSIPSLLEEMPIEKMNTRQRTTHQRGGGTKKKNTDAYPGNKHMEPKQKAKSIKTSTASSSVSSDSSYSSDSSFVTSSSESYVSVRSRSTKRSRRKNRSSTRDIGSSQESRLMAKTEAKTEKQIGRMQRFKNKLGLIFHHHHHHHHHHHDESKVNDLGHATASSDHSHLFFNHLRKMLHRTSKDAETKKEKKPHVKLPLQKAEHGLIDGLLKHVWHTKKAKRSDEAKKLGKSLSKKKKVKKWHWWQKLHKRKGFVRQASRKKPQVRLGFKAKRPPVRALTLR